MLVLRRVRVREVLGAFGRRVPGLRRYGRRCCDRRRRPKAWPDAQGSTHRLGRAGGGDRGDGRLPGRGGPRVHHRQSASADRRGRRRSRHAGYVHKLIRGPEPIGVGLAHDRRSHAHGVGRRYTDPQLGAAESERHLASALGGCDTDTRAHPEPNCRADAAPDPDADARADPAPDTAPDATTNPDTNARADSESDARADRNADADTDTVRAIGAAAGRSAQEQRRDDLERSRLHGRGDGSARRRKLPHRFAGPGRRAALPMRLVGDRRTMIRESARTSRSVRQPAPFFTSSAMRASTRAVSFPTAKETGHISPSSSLASGWNSKVA